MKIRRRLIKLIVSAFALVICVIFVCDHLVDSNADGRTYNNVSDIPARQTGLVLGTSPVSIWTNRRNYYFDRRIQAAAELYKAGKVKRLIVSGGDYRKTEKNGYDEPACMRDSLIKLGIPAKAITLDYDGTRTVKSIENIKNVYGLDSITIISQEYHNGRALYQADYIGVDAIAYNAVTPKEHKASWWRNRMRESLARVKMFCEIIMDGADKGKKAAEG